MTTEKRGRGRPVGSTAKPKIKVQLYKYTSSKCKCSQKISVPNAEIYCEHNNLLNTKIESGTESIKVFDK